MRPGFASASTAAAARGLLLAACLCLGACATRTGHYYQDDGPPGHARAGLAATPDALPRVEPLNARANRPYSALGRNYTPDTGDAPFEQRGMASWYGRQYHGNPTASGEPYDMYAMSAAHPTLPIPSYARVTRVSDGRSVIVRVNDRGPFLQDRVIDLSYAAATRLGIVGPGSGEVTVQKITARDIAAASYGTPAAPAIASAGPVDAPSIVTPSPADAAIVTRVAAAAPSAIPIPVAPTVTAPAIATPGAAAPTAPSMPVVVPPAIVPPLEPVAPAMATDGGASPRTAVSAPATAAPGTTGEMPTPAANATPTANATPATASAMPAANATPATARGDAPAAAPATPAASAGAPDAAATPAVPLASAPAVAPVAAPAVRDAAVATDAAAAMASGKWAVQLGAFALLANAQALRDQVATLLARPEAEQLPAANRQPRIEFDGRLHRVLVGTFDARSTAQRDASQLRRYLARDTALYQR